MSKTMIDGTSQIFSYIDTPLLVISRKSMLYKPLDLTDESLNATTVLNFMPCVWTKNMYTM